MNATEDKKSPILLERRQPSHMASGPVLQLWRESARTDCRTNGQTQSPRFSKISQQPRHSTPGPKFNSNSMSMSKSSRARGSNRGGCGGGFERTNPDYDSEKLRRLRADYDALEPRWRDVFLAGLSRFEREMVLNRRREIPD
jgi:hypothetical protein